MMKLIWINIKSQYRVVSHMGNCVTPYMRQDGLYTLTTYFHDWFATHGSGSHNGNLATAVQSFELVCPDNGQIVSLSRRNDKDNKNDDDFWGAVVVLGALGPVTQMTLSIERLYRMCQVVYENLPWS